MRILFDECVHSRFRTCFPSYDCQTARYAGLAGLKNGALLAAAETAGFDVLITLDRNMKYQQNLALRKIAILVVYARSNTMNDLRLHVSACIGALESIRPGQFIKIGA